MPELSDMPKHRPSDSFFEPSVSAAPHFRDRITAATRIPEAVAVENVLAGARLPREMGVRVQALANQLAQGLRARKTSSGRAGLVQNLLQEYALSSQEGIALMCMAEALLRIPDTATRDALIRDKISNGQWRNHIGKSPSLFVNAATWGLMITGKLVGTHSEQSLSAAIARLVNRGGEPLIRKGVDLAMRMMGEQFVTGETIQEALRNSRPRELEGFRYSFDMLGEAAMTLQDAHRYLRAYEEAIHAIGDASGRRGVYEGPGISIKLSALHPRYSRSQRDRVMSELYPVLVRLCALAKRYDIGLNIDAEEADKLELSLDLLERLAFEPQLQSWDGMGFVVQAYQKRCPFVIDFLVDLARRSKRRLMVRLVKGAYWDSEIKRAQVDGQAGYPVYTRKAYTDASYLACARKLLDAPDAVYPQFATHNAQTLAAVHELADPASYKPGQYEFQCLHGMGEPLYEQVVGIGNAAVGRPCRIYAPVGTHETLLAYLVRRLLENGANTSFVNQISDQSLPIEQLVRDPIEIIEEIARREGMLGLPHPAIPLPEAIYGDERKNSRGMDLSNEFQLRELATAFCQASQEAWTAPPMVVCEEPFDRTMPVSNPADARDHVGRVVHASVAQVDKALRDAAEGAPRWASTPPAERARLLAATADLLEADMPRLMSLLIREAGKSASNAIAEMREAVDFLRYYANEVQRTFDDKCVPLGPVVCISPWNFPLAIFIGQVSAALAAGNVVLAKPAEQTPLIAAEAVRALWTAGVPRFAIQLLPGEGSVVGARLVADPRVQGVLFTGSTEVAWALQRSLVGRTTSSGRAIPLVAETGGQNAMIVDSSALAEQVVTDVLNSAFDSAGQRCSALRVLCVQEEAAERLLDMLLGAMSELRAGAPARLATDVGPVIDADAKAVIDRHVESMRAKGFRVHQLGRCDAPLNAGTFVLPTLIEIERISDLEREVFGPVLHVVRYRREELDELLAQINATGYALTLGLHTRIDETVDRVVGAVHAGNVYVNRNMVGAVVGVQPFGGEGLSGTGPKAGGPLYLTRLLSKRPDDILERVFGTPKVPVRIKKVLSGPTGERNFYTLWPRAAVLCLASDDHDRAVQLAAVRAASSRAIWPVTAKKHLDALPPDVRADVVLADDWSADNLRFDAVLLHGSLGELAEVQRQLAARDGPVISVDRLEPGETSIPLERLLLERSLSVNTAAAGGNATLMTIG
jgi:RHH-type proline utilization regulon transcriptional repressor/proline dehydrogenase/delta 1-pyrroline-5-carboxylate dehydrogenase